MTPFLKELLLITNPQVLSLAEYLNRSALLFILPCFYLSLICEYFSNWDFKGVIKRSMIAFFAIKLLAPIHVTVVDQSLRVSSELVKKYSPNNKFLTAYQKTKVDKKTGVWQKLSSIVEMIVTDPIVLIIFLLSYISFFLLTQLYSLVYHLGIVLIGLCALLSIFSMTSKSLVGAIKTSLWCVLMPIIVAIVLCLIGDSDAFLKTYSGGIVSNLESLIQLLIMTVILLMTPFITSKIMSDSGVSSVAENLGQMAAMSTLIGGGGLIASRLTASASGMKSLATQKAMNLGRAQLSNQTTSRLQKKETAPSVTDVQNNPKSKSKLENANLIDKGVMASDRLFNKKENQLAEVARFEDAKKLGVGFKDKELSLAPYKEEAKAFISRNSKNPKNQTAENFLKFREQRSSQVSPKKDAHHFKKDDWNQLPKERQKEIKAEFGIKPKLAKEGFVYFKKEKELNPIPAYVYQKINYSKKMEELRNEKSFLN